MKKKFLIIIILLLILTGCKEKTYTITFIDDEKLLDSIEVKKGDTLENIENPTKEGYIFVSWLKDGIEYNLNKSIETNLTLIASWVEEPVISKTYTVTFNFGDYTKTQSIKEGEKPTEPTEIPKKEKHKFLGWYIGNTKYNFNEPVNKDLVIEARYEKTRVMIKFELDGGSGTIQREINASKLENPESVGESIELPIDVNPPRDYSEDKKDLSWLDKITILFRNIFS